MDLSSTVGLCDEFECMPHYFVFPLHWDLGVGDMVCVSRLDLFLLEAILSFCYLLSFTDTKVKSVDCKWDENSPISDLCRL